MHSSLLRLLMCLLMQCWMVFLWTGGEKDALSNNKLPIIVLHNRKRLREGKDERQGEDSGWLIVACPVEPGALERSATPPTPLLLLHSRYTPCLSTPMCSGLSAAPTTTRRRFVQAACARDRFVHAGHALNPHRAAEHNLSHRQRPRAR